MDDAVDAPLIGDSDGPADETRRGAPDDEVDAQQESELRRPSLFIWILTITSSFSGLLFGYEWVLFS